MLTGIELAVFCHLSEPKSAESVADAIGSHPENTRLFLDGLAANDLIRKKNGLYQNTGTTQTLLTSLAYFAFLRCLEILGLFMGKNGNIFTPATGDE